MSIVIVKCPNGDQRIFASCEEDEQNAYDAVVDRLGLTQPLVWLDEFDVTCEGYTMSFVFTDQEALCEIFL